MTNKATLQTSNKGYSLFPVTSKFFRVEKSKAQTAPPCPPGESGACPLEFPENDRDLHANSFKRESLQPPTWSLVLYSSFMSTGGVTVVMETEKDEKVFCVPQYNLNLRNPTHKFKGR